MITSVGTAPPRIGIGTTITGIGTITFDSSENPSMVMVIGKVPLTTTDETGTTISIGDGMTTEADGYDKPTHE